MSSKNQVAMSGKALLRMIAFVSGLAAAIGLSATSQAYIITGVTATASSEYTPSFRYAQHAVDGSGLTAGDTSAITADQTQTTNPDNTMWLSNGQANPTLTVDLGASYSVAYLRVFNYNEAPTNMTRGIKTANLLVSSNNVSYSLVGSISIAEATGLSTDTGDLLNFNTLFGGAVTGRYFKFNSTSSWGSPSYTGLSELQFDTPEPSSMALLGVGGLLLARRRRSDRLRVAA